MGICFPFLDINYESVLAWGPRSTLLPNCSLISTIFMLLLSPLTASMSSVNATSFDSSETGVWFYSGDFTRVRNYMVDNLVQKNINTIYFSDVNDGRGWDDRTKASQYTTFINYAHSKGMEVYAVTLEDPKYVLMSEDELRTTFGAFISKTKDKFDTYIIDVEPHTINTKYGNQYPEWRTNQKFYLENYIRMSKILRNIADEHQVQYIDTIPAHYHTRMKNVGIADGVNRLSSHSVNIMAYESSTERIMSSTAKVREESNIRLVINIKIAKDPADPYIQGQEITRAIKTLKQQSLPIGIWYADRYFLNLDPRLFQP